MHYPHYMLPSSFDYYPSTPPPKIVDNSSNTPPFKLPMESRRHFVGMHPSLPRITSHAVIQSGREDDSQQNGMENSRRNDSQLHDHPALIGTSHHLSSQLLNNASQQQQQQQQLESISEGSSSFLSHDKNCEDDDHRLFLEHTIMDEEEEDDELSLLVAAATNVLLSNKSSSSLYPSDIYHPLLSHLTTNDPGAPLTQESNMTIGSYESSDSTFSRQTSLKQTINNSTTTRRGSSLLSTTASNTTTTPSFLSSIHSLAFSPSSCLGFSLQERNTEKLMISENINDDSNTKTFAKQQKLKTTYCEPTTTTTANDDMNNRKIISSSDQQQSGATAAMTNHNDLSNQCIISSQSSSILDGKLVGQIISNLTEDDTKQQLEAVAAVETTTKNSDDIQYIQTNGIGGRHFSAPIVLAHPEEFRNPSSFLKVYGDPLCGVDAKLYGKSLASCFSGKNGNWNCGRCGNTNYPRRFRCNKCNEVRNKEGDLIVNNYALLVYQHHLKTYKRFGVLGRGRVQQSSSQTEEKNKRHNHTKNVDCPKVYHHHHQEFRPSKKEVCQQTGMFKRLGAAAAAELDQNVIAVPLNLSYQPMPAVTTTPLVGGRRPPQLESIGGHSTSVQDTNFFKDKDALSQRYNSQEDLKSINRASDRQRRQNSDIFDLMKVPSLEMSSKPGCTTAKANWRRQMKDDDSTTHLSSDSHYLYEIANNF